MKLSRLSIHAGRRAQVAAEIQRRRPWYHKIELGEGVCTRFPDDTYDEKFDRAAEEKYAQLSRHLPEDLSGGTVLDVGCCTGLFSLLALERGAAKVIGIDDHRPYIGHANYLIRDALQMKNFEALEASVYNFNYSEPFDHVIFYGILYHLLDPFFALFRLRSLVKGTLYLHTYLYAGAGDKNVSELVYTEHLKAYNNWRHGVNVVRNMLDYLGFDIGQEVVDSSKLFLTATLRPNYFPPKYNWTK